MKRRKLTTNGSATAEVPGRALAAATRSSEASSGGVRGRQPQTSCNFCRHKKLKCDRSRPCSNCVSRGQTCHGGPTVISALSSPADVLERLRRLEQAVFSPENGMRHREPSTTSASEAGLSENKSLEGQGSARPDTDLDYYPAMGDMKVSLQYVHDNVT